VGASFKAHWTMIDAVGNWILVLRGFESGDGPEGNFSVVQEWHCTVKKIVNTL